MMDGQDLEENIFKRNIPGKYSTWDKEDKIDKRNGATEESDGEDSETAVKLKPSNPSAAESELLEYSRSLTKAGVPESVRQSLLADRAGRPATGVKGVLADYWAQQVLDAAQRQAHALQRQQVLTRMVQGHVVPGTCEQSKHTPLDIQTGATSEIQGAADAGDAADAMEQQLDDEDDAFMREFRAKRMKALKRSVAMPVFGLVKDISNGADFLAQLNEEDKRVLVVVHIYEPSVQECVRLNNILDEVAAKMPSMKFLRMGAYSNGIELDRVTLPILSLYRAGELLQTVAVAHDLGTSYFTVADVEWILESSAQDLA